MMTASWGGFGVFWHKNICFCVIRPTRYTYAFMEKAGYFTLNFFEKKYKKILNFCGTKSGRDVNKMDAIGADGPKRAERALFILTRRALSWYARRSIFNRSPLGIFLTLK